MELVEQIFENCALYRHSISGDERGSLIALEGAGSVPFDLRRVYFLYGTRPGVSRGFHSHRELTQWAVCVAGSCTFVLDNGRERREVRLDSPEKGLLIGNMLWREMHDFTPGTVLMVLASAPYDEADYIRDYDEFLAEARQ